MGRTCRAARARSESCAKQLARSGGECKLMMMMSDEKIAPRRRMYIRSYFLEAYCHSVVPNPQLDRDEFAGFRVQCALPAFGITDAISRRLSFTS